MKIDAQTVPNNAKVSTLLIFRRLTTYGPLLLWVEVLTIGRTAYDIKDSHPDDSVSEGGDESELEQVARSYLLNICLAKLGTLYSIEHLLAMTDALVKFW